MWKYVLTSLTWPCPIHINVKLRFRAIPFVRAWHPFDRDPECSNHSVAINHFTRKIMSGQENMVSKTENFKTLINSRFPLKILETLKMLLGKNIEKFQRSLILQDGCALSVGAGWSGETKRLLVKDTLHTH